MYGVIDIGSNTIRLVIYKYECGTLRPMINKKFSVGLASYISDENILQEEGINKTILALKEFKEILYYISVKEVFPFATASIRNVKNSKEVIEQIKKYTDFDVRVLSGSEEATFDYYGAIESMDLEEGLLVDIGGGSTELVFFKNKEVFLTHSIPIGSLNLYKKFVTNLVPNKKELKKIKDYVNTTLLDLNLNSDGGEISCEMLCGVGGTIRATKKLLYDMNSLYTENYSVSFLDDLLDRAKKDSSFFYNSLLQSSADRIHTFVPGLIILKQISSFYSSKVIYTSPYGVREGFLHCTLQEKSLFE
ncbi:MAG: hypothetical protein ACK5LY_08580 [Lachnospirales bacterium]